MKAFIITAVVAWSVGFYLGNFYSENKLLKFKQDVQTAYEDSLKASKDKILLQQRNFDDAIATREKELIDANARINDLNDVIDGLRDDLRGKSGTELRDHCSSKSSFNGTETECRLLLGESLQLLKESASLLQKHAVDHDALVKSVAEQ